MIYGHQITQANAYNNNLDDGISRLGWNENMAKIRENQNKFMTTMFIIFFNILSIRFNGTAISTTH